MKLGTEDASIYYHAGMIYYRLGDQQQARQYLQQALKLNPHFLFSKLTRPSAPWKN
jgi:tetratricopeptide (TPR) repeat protein